MLKILGVITARGGSKSVPRKNVRPLCGKPLLLYTAEAARGARHLSRVVLSTEDEEIAELGKRYGVEVPFMRPVELAGDTTPTLPWQWINLGLLIPRANSIGIGLERSPRCVVVNQGIESASEGRS